MAVQVARKAMDSVGVRASQLDAIVLCHTSQCSVLPAPLSTVGRIADELGAQRTFAFSISQQNCVSPIHALRALQSFFQAKPNWRNALVLTSDVILKEPLRAIGTSGFHSDGASAMLISRSEECGNAILDIETWNDSKAMEGIDSEGRYEQNDRYLWTCLQIIRRLQKRAGISSKDLVSLLPQNTSTSAWETIAKMLDLPQERLFTRNIARTAHVFGSDGAVNLKDSRALSHPGKHLVFMSGIGACYGAFLLGVGKENAIQRSVA